ncbi:MAG: hypothetical protein WC656_01990 [Sulfurimonas sp.]|jgi:hypothetical protein
MDVSSVNVNSSVQIDAMKKSMDVQERSVLKVLESADEQSKQVAAQKTGVGSNLNLTA